MNNEESLAWIHSRRTFGTRLGLERMEALCARLGNPEKQLPIVHIGGTNGKGSVVAFLASMLETSGLSVGTFTSPFIETFNDRICLNGTPIASAELTRLTVQVRSAVAEVEADAALTGITEFEVITAVMFLYFAEKRPDVLLLEVGLGGKYDSTNVVDPLCAVITSIGYDHMDILGNSLTEIAEQKAGIIKPGRPIFVGQVPAEARTVFRETAHANAAPLLIAGYDFMAEQEQKSAGFGESFSVRTTQRHLKKVQSSLIGVHQRANAGLAIVVYEYILSKLGLKFSEKDLRKGLLATHWPGRFEVVSQEPLIILDGAHNEPAVKMVKETLREHFAGRKIWLVFAALKTKDVSKMVELLQEIPGGTLTMTTFDDFRAFKPTQEEQEEFGLYYQASWQRLFAEIMQQMDQEDILLFTGSLYFISEVRHFFKMEGIVS